MNGRDFIEGVRRKLVEEKGESGTDRQIADYLGITVQALHNWRGRDEITVRQMVGLLSRMEAKAVAKAERGPSGPSWSSFS